jgi:predicted transcriptional regulator
LDELGLRTEPPIDANMPLRVPRIRFLLHSRAAIDVEEPSEADDVEEVDEEEEATSELGSLVQAFRIAELDVLGKVVECIAPDATIAQAYTRMALNKYSQLVVTNSRNPRRHDIKGIISYQSITKALLNGNPTTVRECLDESIPILRSDADLKDVVPLLGIHDVVLVVGEDLRLQNIVTAWDLAEEFAQLVDQFKRIGEVEARLRALLLEKLGSARIGQFMAENPSPPPHGHAEVIEDLNALTIGDLQRILEHPSHWNELGLRGVDRAAFVSALDRTRQFRNRLMHFQDPLSADEARELTNFCDLVREIQV